MCEKVVVRLEDLVKWTVPDLSGWAHGLKAEPLKASVLRELGTNGRREALHRYRESTLTSGLNFKDVQRERAQLGERPSIMSLQCVSSLSLLLCWMFMYLSPVSSINQTGFYCPTLGLTSAVLTGVIHQDIVGIPPDIMS